MVNWAAIFFANRKYASLDAYRGQVISGQLNDLSFQVCLARQTDIDLRLPPRLPTSNKGGWPAAYLVVIKGEAHHVATQLGCIIDPLTAQIVHPDLASMKSGQELVDGWQAVAKEACRDCPGKVSCAMDCGSTIPSTCLPRIPDSCKAVPPSVPSAGNPIAMIRGVT